MRRRGSGGQRQPSRIPEPKIHSRSSSQRVCDPKIYVHFSATARLVWTMYKEILHRSRYDVAQARTAHPLTGLLA